MYLQKRLECKNPDIEFELNILELQKQHKDYGYRRIYKEMCKQEITINKKKVHRLIKKLDVQATTFAHKNRKYNSYKGTFGKFSPNRLRRRFHSRVSHQNVIADTSEFKYYEVSSNGRMTIKKLYMDSYMDLFNREIINYDTSQNPSGKNIMRALKEATSITSDCKYRKTFHSNRGWGYQMKTYTRALKDNKIYQIMSRKGNCYGNSVSKNFFGIIKQWMYYRCMHYGYDKLKTAIKNQIKYYNEQGIKQLLGWMSPVEYRLRFLAA